MGFFFFWRTHTFSLSLTHSHGFFPSPEACHTWWTNTSTGSSSGTPSRLVMDRKPKPMRTLNHLHTPVPWKDCDSSSVLGPSSSSVLHIPAKIGKGKARGAVKESISIFPRIPPKLLARQQKLNVKIERGKLQQANNSIHSFLPSLPWLHHQSIRINETKTPRSNGSCSPLPNLH